MEMIRLVVEGFLWSCCFCAAIMNKFKLQRAIRAHSQGQHSDAKVSAHLFGFFFFLNTWTVREIEREREI